MNKTRPKQLSFRVSEEEYQQLQEKISESGKNQQEYILSCVLEKQIVNTDGIKELLPELKRIGNNLNQIAKDTYQLLKQAEQGKVKSYVQDIALAVLDCKETATSRETFIRLMNERGYGVDWQDSHKYITYTDLAREQAGEKACKIRDNKLEKYYNMDFGKESMEHEFERNARTAEAEQSKRAASRVKPTEPDRAGKQSAQRSVGDVERELRGIDEAVKSRTSKGRAEQAERRRAEQEAHQRAEAERRAAEEQQRIASRRYIGRDWEPER